MKGALQWLLAAGLAAAQSAEQTQTNPYQDSARGPMPVDLVVTTLGSSSPNGQLLYDLIPLTNEAYLRLPVCFTSEIPSYGG